jgi:hypothetical protein
MGTADGNQGRAPWRRAASAADRRHQALAWCQTVAALAAAGLAALTVAAPQWIESVFGLDPDQHNGSLELIVVLAFALASIWLGLAARREWRRHRLLRPNGFRPSTTARGDREWE